MLDSVARVLQLDEAERRHLFDLARAEPVLAAWGIDTEGKPVFVALAAGGSESTDAWGDFLDELTGRGLRPPPQPPAAAPPAPGP